MNDRERLRTAWLCWGVPAFAGLVTTALFLLTSHPLLEIIGFLCVPIGALLALVGLTHLAAARTGPRVVVALLILNNFPLAGVCGYIADRHTWDYTGSRVVVMNHSDRTINWVVVTHNNFKTKTTSIPSGAIRRIGVTYGSGSHDDMMLTVRCGPATYQMSLGYFDADDFIATQVMAVEVTNAGIRAVRNYKDD